MRDLGTELREYIDTFDTPFDPHALMSETDALQSLSTRAPQSTRRGLAVALGAASLVLVVAGLAFLGAGLIGGGGTPIATPAVPTPTAPAVVTDSVPGTTTPTEAISPPQVEGTWTTYSTGSGLPQGGTSGLAVGGDGTVWAAQLGADGGLYRFDGAQWAPVGETREIGTLNWMIATPDGGIAIGSWSQILYFDGRRWLDPIYGSDISAIVNTADGYRILGYRNDSELVDVRFLDGTFEVKSATRGDRGGSSPSSITVWDTVDIDSAGNAWFGTVEGAWRFDGEALELFEFGVVGDCCAPLAVDRSDNVWTIIQTHGDLYRLSPDGVRTRYTPDDGIPFLRKDANPAILPTSDGSVWVLNRAGDAARFDGNRWTAFTPEEARAVAIPIFGLGGRFGVVDGPDGSTWTVEHGDTPVIHRFIDGTWQIVPTLGSAWGSVGADYGTLGMAVAPDGSLWIPTSTGVAQFDPTDV